MLPVYASRVDMSIFPWPVSANGTVVRFREVEVKATPVDIFESLDLMDIAASIDLDTMVVRVIVVISEGKELFCSEVSACRGIPIL